MCNPWEENKSWPIFNVDVCSWHDTPLTFTALCFRPGCGCFIQYICKCVCKLQTKRDSVRVIEPEHVCVRETYVIISHSPHSCRHFWRGKESLVTQQGSIWAFIYITNLLALKIIIHNGIRCLIEVKWRSLGFSSKQCILCFYLVII